MRVFKTGIKKSFQDFLLISNDNGNK